MKKIKIIAVAAFFVIGSMSFAQGPGQGGGRQMRSATERAKQETKSLIKALDLDEAQTAKIQEVNLKFAVKDSVRFTEMRSSGAQMDRETMMTEMRKNTEAKSAEVEALLKPEQIEKYKKFVEERNQRPSPGGQGGPGQGGQDGPGPGGQSR